MLITSPEQLDNLTSESLEQQLLSQAEQILSLPAYRDTAHHGKLQHQEPAEELHVRKTGSNSFT
jgi:hypothetical protein